MTTFGDRLRDAREIKGWKQGKLAAEIGVTQAAISQLENGRRRPTPALVTKLAEALEVKRELLAGKTEGQFEHDMLMRNLKGLSPDSLKRINEYVDLIRKSKEK